MLEHLDVEHRVHDAPANSCFSHLLFELKDVAAGGGETGEDLLVGGVGERGQVVLAAGGSEVAFEEGDVLFQGGQHVFSKYLEYYTYKNYFWTIYLYAIFLESKCYIF